MKSDITLIRAIGTEYVGRKLKPIALLFGGIAWIVLALVLWLTTVNAWWWLLAVPVMVLALMGTILLAGAWLALRLLRPKLSPEQGQGTAEFVDKLERVIDRIGTPVWFMAARMLLDVIRPRGQTFLGEVADDGKTLHPDFVRLRQAFK